MYLNKQDLSGEAPPSAVLHLLCGDIAAGKSCLAKRLARRHQAILVSEEEWLSKLFPNGIHNLHDYLSCSRRLQILFAPYCVELLQSGRDVVFDFPANSPEIRRWLKQLIDRARVRHLLHYVTASKQDCKVRLIKRINSDEYFSGEGLISEFDSASRLFVAPRVEEGFNVEINR